MGEYGFLSLLGMFYPPIILLKEQSSKKVKNYKQFLSF